jgi:hypothetical protein
MSRRTESIDRAYFDTLYAADPDPWRFATSAYERDKYAASLAALPDPAYGSVLEIGCSIGVFTRQLAGRSRWRSPLPMRRSHRQGRTALWITSLSKIAGCRRSGPRVFSI